MASETSSTNLADRLNDDVVAEILVRLPSASVLHSRGVCQAWRCIAASPAFLAAHARRSPLELVFKTPACSALYTIPLATLDETRRRLLPLRGWCSELAARPANPWRGGLQLLDTCDGLLLFETRSGSDHLVCNPSTRQAMLLPRTPTYCIRACGLYIHGPSGQHRLLYLANDADQRRTEEKTASHYVLSLGAAEARRLEPPADAAIDPFSPMPEPYLRHRGNLHWLYHPQVFDTDKILAFDTVSETFRRIPRPPLRGHRSENPFLVEAHGALAVAVMLAGSMDLWVLEDYSSDSSWTHRLQVSLPPPLLSSACFAVDAGVLGQNVILLENNHAMVLYDLTEKKVLKQIKLPIDSEDICLRPTSLVFRESLERHAFFDLHCPS